MVIRKGGKATLEIFVPEIMNSLFWATKVCVFPTLYCTGKWYLGDDVMVSTPMRVAVYAINVDSYSWHLEIIPARWDLKHERSNMEYKGLSYNPL